MSSINRAQSLKSPRERVFQQGLNSPVLDQSDGNPSTNPISRFFSSGRHSKEIKTTESDESRRSSTASTGELLASYSQPRVVIPRDSLLLNAPDSRRRYFMGHQSRGIAMVVNNKKFHPSLSLGTRHGTDVDAAALEDMFLNMGFTRGNVHRYDDVAHRDMQRLMDHYAKNTNFEDMDCFVCVILSHGKDNGAIFGYDGKTTLDLLLEPFKKQIHPTLLGKPKIFLVQACRGERFEGGVLMPDSTESDAPSVQCIPLEADFLYAYSTVPGYFSWRNASKGSWFIEALAKNIKEHRTNPDMDFVRILTRVNHDVAYEYQSNVPDDDRMHLKKQMPSIVSMLTKELYFA